MSSTSPPAACQEKTSSPGVQCHNLPLGTLVPACLSRLVMLATHYLISTSSASSASHHSENLYCFLV